MRVQAEIVVMGGGIAGLSLVSELARRRLTGRGVVLLEAEDQLAHHTSSRSAQHLSPAYGPEAVRELTDITVTHLAEGLPGLDTPVVWPCPTVVIGTRQEIAADKTFESNTIPRAEVLRACPELAPMPDSLLEAGMFETDAVRSDASALLAWHREQAESAGVEIITSARVTAAHNDDVWVLTAGEHRVEAPVVVNATGAWADQVAELFGARPLGLQPLRRTAAMVELERAWEPEHPVVVTANGGWYYRPDPQGALISTGEAEPEEPCDAQPLPGQMEALVETLNSLTDLRITGIIREWTGQRTATMDDVPVCGFDPQVKGFLWLAGQSGYGFQTSTAMARAAADLLLDGAIGPWCTRKTATALDPGRL